jgi:hypothetical protein
MSEISADKVKSLGLSSFLRKDDKNLNSAPLINFVPKKSAKSEILNDYQISNLIEYFPSIIKTKDWELLFTPNKDGVSMSTFYDRTKDWKLTLIVV